MTESGFLMRPQREEKELSAVRCMAKKVSGKIVKILAGYDPMLVEIIQYFRTGKVPVANEQTLEIFAFMEAADESKRNDGAPVALETVMQKAKQKAKEYKI